MTLIRHFKTFWTEWLKVLNSRMNVVPDIQLIGYFNEAKKVKPKHIVIVGYDDLTSLDLSGPLEAFSTASLRTRTATRSPATR